MRVLITDHAATANGKAGVGYYASELIRGVRSILGADAVTTFPGGWDRTHRWIRAKQRWWSSQSSRWEAAARTPGMLPWVEKKVRGKFLSLVRKVVPPPADNALVELLGRSGCQLYHEPNFIATPFPGGLPTLVSVHDLSVLLRPDWHPAFRVAAFEEGFREGLKGCDRVIAISEAGKREIVRHLGWPADRVTVTYMGVRPGLSRPPARAVAATLRRLGLSEGYLLHVGTLEPRKNVLMLLRAYCSLPAPLRERCPLVLAGGKGWNSEATHAYLEGHARHKNVRYLGYVEDRHFPALYSAARALLFPTFYEGFGMPTIEMMACGGAVLASTAEAVAETVGGHAHLIDPSDEGGWRDAMARACSQDDWLASLRRGVEAHAAGFTWARCAEDTVAAYRLVLSSRRAA